MQRTRNLSRLRKALPLVAGFVCAPALAHAQGAGTMAGYPPNNAAWLTTPTGSAISIPSTATLPAQATYATNGLGTLRFAITGTYTGLVATFQCSNDRNASPLWKSRSVQPAAGAGGQITNVTANGVYEMSGTGCAQVALNVTALATGTVSVDVAGTPAADRVTAFHERRPTYSAAFAALTPAASATDFLTICGNATTTVRVTRLALNGTSTAAATATVSGIVRSTADTTGTSTSPAAVPHDANDPAASSAIKIYTANPGALGTSVGTIRAGMLTTNTVAASAFASNDSLSWTFGDRWNEEVVLRGTTQCLALNNGATSFTSGTSLAGSIEWTEE